MTNQKQILSTYRNIIEMIKTNLVRDLATANSTGAIAITSTDLERISNLTGTFIDLYAANGYEMLQNQTMNDSKPKKSKK
mgnify:CR=1 FL=1|jgi:N12 class adenine-specific DNA methylase|tara:strand:+ start:1268 stop:1507 length:240 start_codon:yes stop_codon:yes gene_type:complete